MVLAMEPMNCTKQHRIRSVTFQSETASNPGDKQIICSVNLNISTKKDIEMKLIYDGIPVIQASALWAIWLITRIVSKNIDSGVHCASLHPIYALILNHIAE